MVFNLQHNVTPFIPEGVGRGTLRHMYNETLQCTPTFHYLCYRYHVIFEAIAVYWAHLQISCYHGKKLNGKKPSNSLPD
ncbi:hypothetical protein SFRURICE_013703 [Spodoptera frugiperda]|nr:hypothetical protein SFRURICE_013703 [Spodoptera frugiperda]